MSTQYNADAIEVLNGLEPVRRRPGMYTDTTRPNHLGQEVIDNSVDEALAGHARTLEVTLYEDQSLEVIDDGRPLPGTGGTGLGQIAIVYGHQRFNQDIIWLAALLCIIIVQVIQEVGMYIVRKTDKRTSA